MRDTTIWTLTTPCEHWELQLKASDQIALGALGVSVLALLWTIISSMRDRAYTRKQITASQTQFAQTNIPKVTAEVRVDSKGPYLQIHNESSAIAASQLTAELSGSLPDGKIEFTSIPDDIKPSANRPVRGSTTLTKIRSINMDTIQPWPTGSTFELSLEFSYLPKQDGAQTVHVSRKVFVEIDR